MTKLSETEFKRLCEGVAEDRTAIIRHNPLGTDNEILLWMLLNCLNSYLSLSEKEMPCFTGRPDEATYRNAVMFVIRSRMAEEFDAGIYIDKLLADVS